MKFQFTPVLLLRLGLSLVFIYAGLYMALDTGSWTMFVPERFSVFGNPKLFTETLGVLDLVLGIFILLGFWLRILALVAAFQFFGILLFYGIDDITFRDFGLLFSALALFFLCSQDKRG